MNVSINVFVFCICALLAFGCGLDEDLTEIKHIIRKLIEENTAILRNEVESIRGQCGEVFEENAILRNEIEAINLKLEGVQEGSYHPPLVFVISHKCLDRFSSTLVQ